MRTKEKYNAQTRGAVRSEGRNVVIPISVDKDPTRIVELKIPRSQAPAVLRAAVRAVNAIDGT